MKLKIASFLLVLFYFESALTSRTYDPFEGGKFACHREDKTSSQHKDSYFNADFSIPTSDKQTKFKPKKIQLTTGLFKEEGFLFKTRKLRGIEDFSYYFELGEHVILCGEKLSELDIASCSYKGGDDNTDSPEMAYFINCAEWRLHMEINQNNELIVECTNRSGKTILAEKFPSCTRTQ